MAGPTWLKCYCYLFIFQSLLHFSFYVLNSFSFGNSNGSGYNYRINEPIKSSFFMFFVVCCVHRLFFYRIFFHLMILKNRKKTMFKSLIHKMLIKSNNYIKWMVFFSHSLLIPPSALPCGSCMFFGVQIASFIAARLKKCRFLLILLVFPRSNLETNDFNRSVARQLARSLLTLMYERSFYDCLQFIIIFLLLLQINISSQTNPLMLSVEWREKKRVWTIDLIVVIIMN